MNQTSARSFRRSNRGGVGPAVALFLAAALTAAVITVRVAAPGLWHWMWDKDARRINPPQYLVQIPTYLMHTGSGDMVYWNDHKTSRDYSSYWRMIESTDSVISGVSHQGFPKGEPVHLPTKNKSGPFWTYRDLRKKMIDFGVKQVTLYNSTEVVKDDL
jgi:hypothetical protein